MRNESVGVWRYREWRYGCGRKNRDKGMYGEWWPECGKWRYGCACGRENARMEARIEVSRIEIEAESRETYTSWSDSTHSTGMALPITLGVKINQ